MCNIKDAQRELKLAQLFETEHNRAKAVEHYLEACSIYVLNAEVLRQEKWIDNANHCYHQVQRLRKQPLRDYTKSELAKLTLPLPQPKINLLDEIERVIKCV